MKPDQRIPRHRYTAAERREFVSLYRKSGLTQSEFARQHQLNICTLHQWIHRANKLTTPAPEPLFKEVLLPPPPPTPGWAAEIIVGNDLTLRLGSQFSPQLIIQVIRQLRRSC